MFLPGPWNSTIRILAEYEATWKVRLIRNVSGHCLGGLGLPAADFVKPIGVLSGGQKKLIGLVR